MSNPASESDEVREMHARQLERLRDGRLREYDEAGRYRGPAPVNYRPHRCDRGAIHPDGRRGCWDCWIRHKLGLRPHPTIEVSRRT